MQSSHDRIKIQNDHLAYHRMCEHKQILANQTSESNQASSKQTVCKQQAGSTQAASIQRPPAQDQAKPHSSMPYIQTLHGDAQARTPLSWRLAAQPPPEKRVVSFGVFSVFVLQFQFYGFHFVFEFIRFPVWHLCLFLIRI